MRAAILLFVILLYSFSSWPAEPVAEEKDKPSRWDWGASVGTFLPYGIVGVRDEYPSWAIQAAHPFKGLILEYQYLGINAKAVTFHNVSVAFRFDGDMALSEKNKDDVLRYFFTLGADENYYKRKPSSIEFPYVSVPGMHFGGGFYFQIFDSLYMRFDMKYMISPANSVYVGIGFQSIDFAAAEKEGR